MGGRTAYTPWGSSKIQRTLSVTPEAWELWTRSAASAGINRSELFEVLARTLEGMNVEHLRYGLLTPKG